MDRRRFLRVSLGAGVAGLAGCAGGDADADRASPTGRNVSDAGVAASGTDSPLVDVDLPLDETDLHRATSTDDIPAVTEPAVAEDWSSVGPTLSEDDRVIGVTTEDAARAYPLGVLNWHEVVNDRLGEPLLVTYCPLCGSGVVAERRVDGQETTFGVSGYLWRRDLVLYDDLTDSLWSQLLARAVRGSQTGTRLSLRPAAITTWGEWRADQPDTDVLLPPPRSGTVAPTDRPVGNYNVNPYGDYEFQQPTGGSYGAEPVLSPKHRVVGVATDSRATAYPLASVLEAGGVVNDAVGDLPVVVASTRDSLVAYERRVDGTVLSFGRTGDRARSGQLTAGGSRWRPTSGRALDGPFEGTTLARANDRSPMYWLGWSSFYPDTAVYGRQG